MEEPVVLVEPNRESLGAQANPRPPVETMARRPARRRSSRSVFKLSQLLLRAICGHRRLNLPTLRKELSNAGYEVRRRVGRQSGGGRSRRQRKGAFLRVSGSNASGSFRIRKVLRPKKKPARRRLEEASVSSRVLRRRRTLRKAAKVAREVWRQDAKRKRLKSRGRSLVRPKTKVGTRRKVKAKGKPWTRKEAQKPDPREDWRASSSSKPPEETLVKRNAPKPTQAKTDLTLAGQAKPQGVKAASTKSESSKPAMGTP